MCQINKFVFIMELYIENISRKMEELKSQQLAQPSSKSWLVN